MGKPATGSIEWVPPKKGELRGHYKVRLSLADGSRPWVHLNPGPRSAQAERSAREAAGSMTERARRENRTGADFGLATTRSKTDSSESAGTMLEWVDAWTAMKRARGKTSTTTTADSHYATHIEPVLGQKHIRDWNADDLRKLARSLDAKVAAGEIKWKTAANVWATVTSMLTDARRSNDDDVRVRSDNPGGSVEGPARGNETAKQFLFPDEFLRFVSCTDVPWSWRCAAAIGIYTYARAGELRALRWEDVDIDHLTIHIHRAIDKETDEEKSTKSGMARRIPIEAMLAPLLQSLYDRAQAVQPDEDIGSMPVIDLPSKRDMARGLRRWLKRAKVDREELHSPTATRKAITFHDLRATGLTWMAIRGDEPLKIMQRAGHTDFATTQIYVREAENLREGFGSPFPPIPNITGDKKEERENRPDDSDDFPVALIVTDPAYICGADGTRKHIKSNTYVDSSYDVAPTKNERRPKVRNDDRAPTVDLSLDPRLGDHDDDALADALKKLTRELQARQAARGRRLKAC